MGKGFGDWWPSCLGESNTHGPGFSVRGNLWASCNQVKDGKQSLVRVGAGICRPTTEALDSMSSFGQDFSFWDLVSPSVLQTGPFHL